MKRPGVLLVPAILAFTIAGCGDSGIKEGSATGDLPATGQTAGFQEEMKRSAEKMKLKKSAKPKNVPTSTPTPTPETKEAP